MLRHRQQGLAAVDAMGMLAKLLLLSALMLSALAIEAPQARAEVAALPAAWKTALSQVLPDPPPKQLAADAHFVISDERAHYTFYPATKGLGGVLLGVGTDPNYLIAGWMNAELVLVVDFDQVVADVHALYALAFAEAADSEAFVKLWSAKNLKGFAELIEKNAPDKDAKKRWTAAYKMSRGLIAERLNALKRTYREQKVPTFLSDPAQYQHVRSLVQQGRVWAWRGDLTADKTMAGVQKALTEMGQQVKVFYITNAEAYFPYTKQARKNLRDLPYAEDSVVLRTQGRPDKPDQIADHHYSYYVQKGPDFVAWLQKPSTTSAKTIGRSRIATKVQGLYTLPAPPVPKVKGAAKGSKAKAGADKPKADNN